MDSPTYRKLPGAVRQLLWREQLWIGPDHLLAVHTTLGLERYRRFPFASLQALVVRRTRRRLAVNLICGGLGGALLAGGGVLIWMGKVWPSLLGGRTAMTAAPEVFTYLVFSVILALPGLLLLAFLVLNSLRGPTCTLYFQTAAGVEPAGSPNRWRTALRVQQELAPLILAAQTAAAESPAPAAPPSP